MTQSQIEFSVARITGESLREVRRRGFSIADPEEVDFDPEPGRMKPQVVDWDELDQQRVQLFP